jgi:hypothetical protein
MVSAHRGPDERIAKLATGKHDASYNLNAFYLRSEPIMLCARVSGLSFLIGCGLLVSGCMTDAATRLADDVVKNARVLERSSATERAFIHYPRSSPYGCKSDYTVIFQCSLEHPAHGGMLVIGCKEDAQFHTLGFSYTTTYHLNAVRVPMQISVEKPADAPLRVLLHKYENGIEIIGVE